MILDYRESGPTLVVYEPLGSSNFGFGATSVFVGDEPFPRDLSGEYTVAPGQYGNLHDPVANATYDEFTFTDLGEDKYFIFWATSCELP